MAKLFLGLGAVWLGYAVYEFLTGAPSAWKAPLLTAGVNLLVSVYLFWRSERRRADR